MLQHRTAGSDVHREVAPARTASYLNGVRRRRQRDSQRREARCPTVNLHFHAGRSCLNREGPHRLDRGIPLVFPGGCRCRRAAEQDHADPFERRGSRAPIARRTWLGRTRHRLRDRPRTERRRNRFGAERIEAVDEGIGKRDSRRGADSFASAPGQSRAIRMIATVSCCLLLVPDGLVGSAPRVSASHVLAACCIGTPD